MSKHILKVLEVGIVTHNVRRFVLEKPEGFEYVPGQATEIAINKTGLDSLFRPFTFTSIPSSDFLEFIIKIYVGHDGMTEKLASIKKGDELIINDVFGAIHYKGAGLFIAAGAGITPFISIFRQLSEDNDLPGNCLLFANQTSDDIILGEELFKLLGEDYENVIEYDKVSGTGARINREMLKQKLSLKTQYCYICGPVRFTETMFEYLTELGVMKSNIVVEQ